MVSSSSSALVVALVAVLVLGRRAAAWPPPIRPRTDARCPRTSADCGRRSPRCAAETRGALRHLAVVRYDAFGDVGGHLSWSVALLDDAGDGVVLTSIHGRSEARTYAKTIAAWSCEQPLSPEEEEAVAHARPERCPLVAESRFLPVDVEFSDAFSRELVSPRRTTPATGAVEQRFERRLAQPQVSTCASTTQNRASSRPIHEPDSACLIRSRDPRHHRGHRGQRRLPPARSASTGAAVALVLGGAWSLRRRCGGTATTRPRLAPAQHGPRPCPASGPIRVRVAEGARAGREGQRRGADGDRGARRPASSRTSLRTSAAGGRAAVRAPLRQAVLVAPPGAPATARPPLGASWRWPAGRRRGSAPTPSRLRSEVGAARQGRARSSPRDHRLRPRWPTPLARPRSAQLWVPRCSAPRHPPRQ